ncbi:hypothetical protein AVEN_27253-1 [Araneus ventricosus]|uniref:Uncharacterized protein n=1 Tax=Araneus ventricosus TaxID=182803 RepID=A0A4Y2CCU4_ARAVE|nr:hypothetical protein AVEN_27253-1 [Araneus ventricosus]
MLLAMLTDDRCHIINLAARRIIKAREIVPDDKCVRRFVIPVVNFRAADCIDLIDWQACNVTPPPVLRPISFHELLKMIQEIQTCELNYTIKHSSVPNKVAKIWSKIRLLKSSYITLVTY